MEKYEFIGHWTNASLETPPNATRCLVTDGELIVIATYITDDTHSVWLFQGLAEKDKFDVSGWMDLPRPMKKPIAIQNEKAMDGN